MHTAFKNLKTKFYNSSTEDYNETLPVMRTVPITDTFKFELKK